MGRVVEDEVLTVYARSNEADGLQWKLPDDMICPISHITVEDGSPEFWVRVYNNYTTISALTH